MKFIVLFLFLFLSAAASAKDSEIQVIYKDEIKTYKASELLKSDELINIEIPNDPSYANKRSSYQAVPITILFEGLDVPEDAVIEFSALDGFSAPLSKQRLLNSAETESIAYLAIEPTDKPWPRIESLKAPPGPFYLIWKNPELSQIGREEWPFQLKSFEVKESLQKLYPKIYPKSKDVKVQRGLQTFLKNCFACHTMNGQGSSKFGPDLNQPMNPTEYFKETALRNLIRNPKNLRTWSEQKMPGFPKTVLSDKELDDLITYLKAMKKS